MLTDVRGPANKFTVLVPTHSPSSARVGDWVEVRGHQGREGGRGQIVEILGAPGREHYQVRWNEHHESMVFPDDEVRVILEQELPRP